MVVLLVSRVAGLRRRRLVGVVAGVGRSRGRPRCRRHCRLGRPRRCLAVLGWLARVAVELGVLGPQCVGRRTRFDVLVWQMVCGSGPFALGVDGLVVCSCVSCSRS